MTKSLVTCENDGYDVKKDKGMRMSKEAEDSYREIRKRERMNTTKRTGKKRKRRNSGGSKGVRSRRRKKTIFKAEKQKKPS